MSSRRLRPALAASAAALAAFVLVLGTAWASEPEWNIARIGAPASASGTVIAIVDSGVDGSHPAFAGRVLPAIDLVDGRGGDANGHGTHVAGTAAGADAGCGSIGVAPDARILPVRVLDEEGEGTVDDVAEGIRRAADAGAAVINLSLGTDVVLRSVSGSGLQDAIEYAWSKGSIPVLAAGNDGVFGGLLGSGYGGIPAVVVTATDNRDRVASYATSIGSADWGLAAPGGDTSGVEGRDILSAFPDDRCALHAGTSMAAPHVSGALAVLRARGLGPQEAVQHLLATARDLGAPGPDGTYGHGLVDLGAALAGLSGTPVSSAASEPPAPATTAPPTSTPAPAPERGGGAAPAPRDGGTTDPVPPAAADDAPTGEPTNASAPSSTTRPDSEARAGEPTEAAQAMVTDADTDSVPGALVAVAAIGVAVSGAATSLASRSLRRRA